LWDCSFIETFVFVALVLRFSLFGDCGMSLCKLEFTGIVFVPFLGRFFLAVLEDMGFALAVGWVMDSPFSVALSTTSEPRLA
jgi:hypothetical protein